jgi:hypothetical protein
LPHGRCGGWCRGEACHCGCRVRSRGASPCTRSSTEQKLEIRTCRQLLSRHSIQQGIRLSLNGCWWGCWHCGVVELCRNSGRSRIVRRGRESSCMLLWSVRSGLLGRIGGHYDLRHRSLHAGLLCFQRLPRRCWLGSISGWTLRGLPRGLVGAGAGSIILPSTAGAIFWVDACRCRFCVDSRQGCSVRAWHVAGQIGGQLRKDASQSSIAGSVMV